MSLSRRKLIGFGAATGLVVTACGPGMESQTLASGGSHLDALSLEKAQAQLGSRFEMVTGPWMMQHLQLTGVTDHRKHLSAAHRQRGNVFSLLFQASDAEHLLPQDVYRLEHPSLGAMSLLLVPLGPGSDGVPRYEAVINRQEPA